MRIAYVCADPGVPAFGRKGCSVHVREVIRAALTLGATVDLFASRLDGDAPDGQEAVRVHRLPRPTGEPAAREREALAANSALAAALRDSGPFDLIYERYSLWSFAGMESARALGIPGLLEVNAPLIEEQAEHRGLKDRPEAERVADRIFRAASGMIAVSEEVADYLRRRGAAADRVHVIPNGVDADRFRPGLVPALPGRPGGFTVGFVGTLKPWHGLPVLADAFERLHRVGPESRLLIVGDGPERESLASDLARRRLPEEAVRFTGAVDPAEVPALLASMDVSVAPYPDRPDFYFSPLKAYESMAMGLPVVASRIGQLATRLRDGIDGLLCAPGDPSELAGALDRLRRDPELRAQLGRTARAAILRDQTWEVVVARILGLADRIEAQRIVPFPVEVR